MYTVLIESIGGMPPPQMFEEKIDTNITLLHIQETYQDYNDNSNEEITDTSLKEYLTKVDKIPKLTKEEEINLLEKIAKGDEASLKQFVNSHLKLVVMITIKWSQKGNSNLSDLIQEGNIALIKAVHTFNSTKGYKFEDYAKLLINQSMGYALAKDNLIHIPPDTIRLMRSLLYTYTFLQTKLQRNPTIEELATEMKTSKKYIEKLIMRMPQNFIPLLEDNQDIENTENQTDIEDIITQIDVDIFKKQLPDLLSQLSNK